MSRNLLIARRSFKLPLEYPLLDSLKIYANRLLVTVLIYGVCLVAFLIFTGQIFTSMASIVLAISMPAIIYFFPSRLLFKSLAKRSKSADDEIDE
jgi:hypothetical protein